MTAPAISLVIFDCDGVLIDSELLSTAVLVDMLNARGIAIDRDHVLANFIGHPYPVVAGKIAAFSGQALPESFGAEYQAALLDRFDRDLKPMAGIEEVLEKLAVPSCVATSSAPQRARHSLNATGLSRFFGPRVYTVSMVARVKPAPDLFLHAARKMGAAPETCLVIEDSPLGIAAAKTAGMRVWLFSGGGHFAATYRPHADAIPDRVFGNMAEFYAEAPELRR